MLEIFQKRIKYQQYPKVGSQMPKEHLLLWVGQVYKLKTYGRTARVKLKDWERAKRNPQVQERLSKLQVLLLDEVSMVSSDFLDRASQLAPRCSSAIISLAEIHCLY